MLRRSNLLDINGNLINPATYETQVNGSQKTQIVDQYGVPYGSISSESGNAIPSYLVDRTVKGDVHFHVNSLVSDNFYQFILIDISDTTNYKHDETGFVHIERFEIEIVCDVNGAWNLETAFIENVDNEGSNFIVWNHWSGNKDTGNRLEKDRDYFPNGPRLHSSKFTSHSSGYNDYFKASVLEKPSYSPGSAIVYPGNGDMVCRLHVSSGTVESFKFNVGYHSHVLPA